MRIALQIVQLVLRRLDVAIARIGERGQLAPAEVVSRVERLRVHRGFRQPAGPVEERLERTAAEIPRYRRLDELEDRRHQVDVLDQIGDAPSRARVALLLDDQRHVHRFLVHEQAVLLLAVVAEAFAVIREQDDRRSVVELMRFQIPDQLADDLVAVRHFAVVRHVLGEPLRRRVRLVRFVEMQEEERA